MNLVDLSSDDLIALYLRSSDRMRERKAAFEEASAKDDTLMTSIEEALRLRLTNEKVEKIACDAGTARLVRLTAATVRDRDSFIRHTVETGDWGLVDFRCSKSAVRKYIEDHGCLPPGIDMRESHVVSIRRPLPPDE